MADVNFITFGLLLVTACLVAIVSRRIGLPYPVGLVLAGIGLNVAGYRTGFALTPELIFTFLLPPLVFEAAIHLSWSQFRREAPQVLSLAFIGTMLSAIVVAAGMHWIVGWSWQASMLFGALIAATDPVSVIALMKERQGNERFKFIVEAESLVNDGVAAVLFASCVAVIHGVQLEPATIAFSLGQTIVGGVLCGVLVAATLLLIAGRSDDHLVELTLTMLAAYGSFAIAEKIGVSGILAALAAGMLMGNMGPGRNITYRGNDAMVDFWAFIAFLSNSIIFLLIGGREAEQPIGAYLFPAILAAMLALVGRMAAIYPIAALFIRSGLAISKNTQHLLIWGGLRGALALALALATPKDLPEHDALVGVAFAVVAFSIFVQGLTFPLLLRRFDPA